MRDETSHKHRFFSSFVCPLAAATSPTASAGAPVESTTSEPSAEVAGTPPEEQMTRYAVLQVHFKRFWRILKDEICGLSNGREYPNIVTCSFSVSHHIGYLIVWSSSFIG